PRLFAAAAAAPKPSGPARLIIASTRRNQGSAVSRLKTLSYLDNILARREAAAADADEAVMLNTRGEVACAAAANLFWRSRGRLFTPALACGVLDGIIRGELLARARAEGQPIEEVALSAAILADAQALVLTNSLIGVRAVSSLDGRSLDSADMAEKLGAWIEALT
ncbi:MAG TPA: aminotransferase class IV, partial [Caulobacteraceae bacterium]